MLQIHVSMLLLFNSYFQVVNKLHVSHILPQYEHGTPSIASSSRNPSKQDPMVAPCKTNSRFYIVNINIMSMFFLIKQ